MLPSPQNSSIVFWASIHRTRRTSQIFPCANTSTCPEQKSPHPLAEPPFGDTPPPSTHIRFSTRRIFSQHADAHGSSLQCTRRIIPAFPVAAQLEASRHISASPWLNTQPYFHSPPICLTSFHSSPLLTTFYVSAATASGCSLSTDGPSQIFPTIVCLPHHLWLLLRSNVAFHPPPISSSIRLPLLLPASPSPQPVVAHSSSLQCTHRIISAFPVAAQLEPSRHIGFSLAQHSTFFPSASPLPPISSFASSSYYFPVLLR
jgi:hypothetical protein